MLEAPDERIKLLKQGYTAKAIEKLYIEYNKFKIVCFPARIELIEFDMPENKKICMNRQAEIVCA
ncbi:Uncharacterised protein [uncultured archaeon]|nr:Uncharacterised protein [uncultured archaeon]